MTVRRVLCCSTQPNFKDNLPKGLPDDFRKRWELHDIDDPIFRTITITRDDGFKSNIDWEKEKEEGVVMAVLCDDPYEYVLSTFFREVLFTAQLPVYWYSRFNGRPSIIEIKAFGKGSLIGS